MALDYELQLSFKISQIWKKFKIAWYRESYGNLDSGNGILPCGEVLSSRVCYQPGYQIQFSKNNLYIHFSVYIGVYASWSGLRYSRVVNKFEMSRSSWF